MMGLLACSIGADAGHVLYMQPSCTISEMSLKGLTSAGLVPGSAAEGMRVTHGRPPCALVAFGIGGRVAVLKPVIAHGTTELLSSCRSGQPPLQLRDAPRADILQPAQAMACAPAGHGSKPVYATVVDLDSRWMPGRLSITRMGSLAAYLGSSGGTGQVALPSSTCGPVRLLQGCVRMHACSNALFCSQYREP